MDVLFAVETTNGKTWKATCSDPSLEVEGPDIISVSKSMAGMIENWFMTTFNTTKKVVVEVPMIKARVKATVSVRSEKSLEEFPSEDGETPIIEATPMKREPPRPPALKEPQSNVITGPCKYISDGKGAYAVGLCEAVSDDPSDTPGLLADNEGACRGEFGKCKFYCGTQVREVPSPFEPTQPHDDFMGVDEEEEENVADWDE